MNARAVLSCKGRTTSSSPQNSNSNKYGHVALLLRPKRQTGSHWWHPAGRLAPGAGSGVCREHAQQLMLTERTHLVSDL